MVNKVTRLRHPLALPITQHVVLQAQRLPVDLLEDRKEQIMLFQALLEVLKGRVVTVFDVHVSHLKLLVVVHPLDELVSLALNRAEIFITRPLKETLQLVFGRIRQVDLLCICICIFLFSFFHFLLQAVPELNLHQLLLCFLLYSGCKVKHHGQIICSLG